MVIDAPDVLQIPKFIVSVCGLILSVIAGVVALRSFLRNEKWKKAEFLASEMKEFFADDRVQKSMLLIDWGVRRIQLFSQSNTDSEGVVVTRQMQVSALRPHVLLSSPDSDSLMNAESTTHGQGAFTPDEARIRDCYDGFLDGLERISSYARTGLVEISALRPYIGYWISEIHSSTDYVQDAAWSASLLTYINFYHFEGVMWLFKAFNCDIGPSSTAYRGFLEKMKDQRAASMLAKSVKIIYP